MGAVQQPGNAQAVAQKVTGQWVVCVTPSSLKFFFKDRSPPRTHDRRPGPPRWIVPLRLRLNAQFNIAIVLPAKNPSFRDCQQPAPDTWRLCRCQWTGCLFLLRPGAKTLPDEEISGSFHRHLATQHQSKSWADNWATCRCQVTSTEAHLPARTRNCAAH
ncbi:hypothetical protein VTI74DRAFT_4996 [Chaetomium olivicolor]